MPMKTEPIDALAADRAAFHGLTIEACPEQIEKILGAPTINYDDGQKSRIEWDERIDEHVVVVFDHHHYGHLDEQTVTQFSVLSDEGCQSFDKLPSGEYAAGKTPTPIELELARAIDTLK